MTTAERLRRAREGDGGFTLIEVVVAMMIFLLIAGAAAAMLVGGTKASVVTRMDTGAKELGQQQLESMRNLLHQPDGGSDASAVELLKKYFPAYAATSVGCATTGFVDAGAARCTSDGDPATGAFYRTVINPVPNFSRYKQYVTVQFMDDQRNPVAVDSSYLPSVPPSGFMNIGVQTMWSVGTMSKKFLLTAYIPSTSPASPTAALSAHVVALTFQGTLDSTRSATLSAGLADLAGNITLGATAAADAQGGFAGITGSDRVDSTVKVVSVPPVDSGAPYSGTDSSPVSLTDNGTEVGYINAPSYSGVGASTTGALPVSGSSTSPVTGYVPKQGSGQKDIRFNNDASPDSRLGIVSGPLAWVTVNSGNAPDVSGTGYSAMTANSGATRHSVSATVGASTQMVHLLPTSYAPDGLVQLQLVSSSMTCQTNGQTASAPAVTYSAQVSFWEDKTQTNWQYSGGTWSLGSPAASAGYTPFYSLTSSQATDPLRTAPLSQIRVATSGGVPLMLSDYISSWRSMTSSEATAVGQLDQATKAVQGSVSSVLGVTTTPMRSGDSGSGLSLTLGQLDCTALDARP